MFRADQSFRSIQFAEIHLLDYFYFNYNVKLTDPQSASAVRWARADIFTGRQSLPRCRMPLNIKDPAKERNVRKLAAVTGETLTAAVRRAAEERLQKVRRDRTARSLAEQILEIGKRCAALPDQDVRTADEILGYDEHGLPS